MRAPIPALALLVVVFCGYHATACDHDGDGYNSTNSTCNGLDCEDYNSTINPAGTELPDNNNDEDCNGWINSSLGFRLRSTHPRTFFTYDEMQQAAERSYGAQAREPYSGWFDHLVSEYNSGSDIGYTNRAFLGWVLENQTIIEDLKADLLVETDTPDRDQLVALDIVFGNASDSLKHSFMQRANDGRFFYPDQIFSHGNRDTSFDVWHASSGVAAGAAYSAIFAMDDVWKTAEVQGDLEYYTQLNTSGFLAELQEWSSPGGYFYDTEQRAGGSTEYHRTYPGDLGGAVCSLSYDFNENSHSIEPAYVLYKATGHDVLEELYHSRYRSDFNQNMMIPHTYTSREAVGSHARPSYATASGLWLNSPDEIISYIETDAYKEPKSQFYVEYGPDMTRYSDGKMWAKIFYYNDTLEPAYPDENPLTRFYPGPGFSIMRSSWDSDAVFSVLNSGECNFLAGGAGRRYRESNTFIISRKEFLIVNAYSRSAGGGDDCSKASWYHTKSIGRNTLRVFDPDANPTCVYNCGTGERDGCNASTVYYQLPGDFGIMDLPSKVNAPPEYGPYNEWGSIMKHEDSENYTYSLGEGTYGFDSVELFEREYMWIKPDIFVIFDRVTADGEGFRKVWRMHTVYEPTALEDPVETGNGMRRYNNTKVLDIEAEYTPIRFVSLLPENNTVVVRGGDTSLLENRSLTDGEVVPGAEVMDSDIARFYEFYITGTDVDGTIRVCGDASEGEDVCEDLVFSTSDRVYYEENYYGRTDSGAGFLTDDTRNMEQDLYKGYMIAFTSSSAPTTVVASNSNDTFYFDASVDAGDAAGYDIFRYGATTQNHYTSLDNLTVSGLEVDSLVISTPHYYDADDLDGVVHPFTYRVDGTCDNGDEKRKDLGRYTLNIENIESPKSENFLNVIYLHDPRTGAVNASLIKAGNISGAFINESLAVLFSNLEDNLTQMEFSLTGQDTVKLIAACLQPDTYFDVRVDGSVEAFGNSSEVGVLEVDLALDGLSSVSISAGVAGHAADLDGDGVVDTAELEAYVQQWKSGSVGISDVLDAISVWK